tara:strand:- start:495 stop:1514 length:1020 start_codon:yes stop_codon:yes gene_type:complete
MTKIPEKNNRIADLIDAVHQEDDNPARTYFGASAAGGECDRALWLSFRWAVFPVFPGRILRLFRRGHNEEESVIADLKSIGMRIDGEQTSMDFGWHVKGHCDGIIESGVPGAEKTRHLLEIKTYSKKRFDALCKSADIRKFSPTHYIQMQLYMHASNTRRALYYAICKDDDRVYTERVEYVELEAKKAIERAHRIVRSDRMPEPISADPSWYKCKFCDAHEMCHVTKLTKEVNCRTCAHSTALENGKWSCAMNDGAEIPTEYSRTGCDAHVLHPDMVPWPMMESNTPSEAVYEINGKPIRNGSPDRFVYASAELVANPNAAGDETVEAYRAKLGARVTG